MIRASVAQDALSDREWLTRFSQRQDQGALEELEEGFPLTVPRDLGTSAAAEWVDDGRAAASNSGQVGQGTSQSSAPKGASSLAVDTATSMWRLPALTGLALSSLALAPRAFASDSPVVAGAWGILAVFLSVSFALLGRSLARQGPRVRIVAFSLAAGALTAIALPVLGGIVAMVGCGLGLLAPRHAETPGPTQGVSDSTVAQQTETFDLDDSAVRLLRARASLYGVDCRTLDEVDRAAVLVGYHAWMYALKAQSIDQASWFGPAAVEGISALIARAAGHGRDDHPLPGLVASESAFPGLDLKARAWKQWLSTQLGQAQAGEALARVSQDLEGSYSDRVSRVSRFLTS